MPSTPRMIEIERKASTPGEGLSRDEVTCWHMHHKHGYDIREHCRPVDNAKDEPMRRIHELYENLSADTHKAIRYLDSTGYRRPMNESP